MDPMQRAELLVFAKGVYWGILKLYEPPEEEIPYRNLVNAIFGRESPGSITALEEMVQDVLTSCDSVESRDVEELKDLVRVEITERLKPFVKTKWPPNAIPLIHAALATLSRRQREALEISFKIGKAAYVKSTTEESARVLGIAVRPIFVSRKQGLERLSRGIFRTSLWVLFAWTKHLRGLFIDPMLIHAQAIPQLSETERGEWHPTVIQALLLPVEALPLEPQHWRAIQKMEINYLFQAVAFHNPEGRRARTGGRVIARASLNALDKALGFYGLYRGMNLPAELVSHLEVWVLSQQK